MIEQDIKEIIPQIPGESDSSYKRLIIMLREGFRTLDELHKHLTKTKSPLLVSYGTLRNNSSKDNWPERQNHFFEVREQELKEEIEELFQELNVIGIHDMKEYIGELQELKEDIITRYKNHEYKASYAFKVLKDYIYCYRQATEIYYINSRHKIEPDTEPVTDIEIEETIIDSELLQEQTMQERIQMMQNILRGDTQ